MKTATAATWVRSIAVLFGVNALVLLFPLTTLARDAYAGLAGTKVGWVLAIVSAIAAYGLWNHHRWGRINALILLSLAVLYLLVAVFGSILFGILSKKGVGFNWWYVSDGVALLINIAVIYLLVHKDVRKQFQKKN